MAVACIICLFKFDCSNIIEVFGVRIIDLTEVQIQFIQIFRNSIFNIVHILSIHKICCVKICQGKKLLGRLETIVYTQDHYFRWPKSFVTSHCNSSLPRVGVHEFHSDCAFNIRFLVHTYKRCWKWFPSAYERLLLSILTFASLLIRVNFPQLGTDVRPHSLSMCVRVGISERQKMGIGLDLRFYNIPYHWEYAQEGTEDTVGNHLTIAAWCQFHHNTRHIRCTPVY